MATTDIRHFRHDMNNQTVMAYAAGSLVALLDFALLTGGADVNTTSVVHAAGTVTVTTLAAHNYEVDQVVSVFDANEADYNGEFIIETITSNSFSYSIDTTPSVDTATGTILCKLAPVDHWEKVYAIGSTVAVYRSTHPDSTGHLIKVIDDASINGGIATLRMYESMTDIDSGVLIKEGYFYKKAATSGSGGIWWFFADPLLVYVFVNKYADELPAPDFIFGNIKSYKPTDTQHCVLGYSADITTGLTSRYTSTTNLLLYSLHGVSASSRAWLAKGVSQLGGAVQVGLTTLRHKISYTGYASSTGWGDGNVNGANGEVFSNPLFVMESNPFNLRGELPGQAILSTSGAGAFAINETINGSLDYANLKFKATPLSHASYLDSALTSTMLVLQINGSWR